MASNAERMLALSALGSDRRGGDQGGARWRCPRGSAASEAFRPTLSFHPSLRHSVPAVRRPQFIRRSVSRRPSAGRLRCARPRRLNRAAERPRRLCPRRQWRRALSRLVQEQGDVSPRSSSRLLTLATSLHGTTDSRPAAHPLRDSIYALAAATGLVCTVFQFITSLKKCRRPHLAEFVLLRPARCAFRDFAYWVLSGFCSERVRELRVGNMPTIFGSSGRPSMAAVMSARTSRHHGRSRPHSFPRRLSQSVHGVAGDAAADWRGLMAERAAAGPGRNLRVTRLVAALAAVWVFAGSLLHIYGVARHGRLAQLEPEHSQRATYARAAEFRRSRACRPSPHLA